MTATHRRDAASQPTLDDLRTGLSRTLGPDFVAAWADICRRADISADVTTLDDRSFDRLLEAIAEQDRLCRVMAMSWRIRRTAAQKLAAINRYEEIR